MKKFKGMSKSKGVAKYIFLIKCSFFSIDYEKCIEKSMPKAFMNGFSSFIIIQSFIYENSNI